MASDSSRGHDTDHDQIEREQREYQPSSPGREPHSQELSSSRREGVAGDRDEQRGEHDQCHSRAPGEP